jgi:hypothetical protein
MVFRFVSQFRQFNFLLSVVFAVFVLAAVSCYCSFKFCCNLFNLFCCCCKFKMLFVLVGIAVSHSFSYT